MSSDSSPTLKIVDPSVNDRRRDFATRVSRVLCESCESIGRFGSDMEEGSAGPDSAASDNPPSAVGASLPRKVFNIQFLFHWILNVCDPHNTYLDRLLTGCQL